MPGAGVFGAVDAVAEPGHGLARAALCLDIGCRVFGRSDFPGHFHDVFCRTAMGRAGQGGDGRRHGGMDRRLGPDHHACGEGRRVGSVFGVQDEVHIGQTGGVLRGLFALQHPQPVRGKGQIGIRRNRIMSVADPVMGRDDHRDLRGQADCLVDHGLGTAIVRTGCHTFQRGHGGAQHLHRVVRLAGADDVQNRVGQGIGRLQAGIESRQFAGRRQLAMDQQIGGFLEGRVFRQIVDREAAVFQLAGPIRRSG